MLSIFSRLRDLFSRRKQPQNNLKPTELLAETQPEINTPETAKESVRPSATGGKVQNKLKATKTNRHGLPLILPKEDLGTLFAGTPEDDTPPPKKIRCRSRDRHGICRLSQSDDLAELFNAQAPIKTPQSALSDNDSSNTHHRRIENDSIENDEFAHMLERQLAGKSLRDLLREKSDGAKPKSLPVSLRIKRYPSPQAELDLHGCTARQAEEKTALFIDASQHQGLLTLRIIVGKGSHSPDGPVLPDAVAGKLSELKSMGRILEFRWEHRVKSKSGAVIVYLDAEK